MTGKFDARLIKAWALMCTLLLVPSLCGQDSNAPSRDLFDPAARRSAEFFGDLVPSASVDRPRSRPGQPLPVYFGLEFVDISEVDAASRRFKARGFIWFYWFDPDIKPRWTELGIEPDRDDELWSVKFDAAELRKDKLVWDSGIWFVNADGELKISAETYEVYPAKIPKVSGVGRNQGDIGSNDVMACLEYHAAFSGWFSDRANRLDFRRFPFDCQDFTIEVDCEYPSSHVLFVPDPQVEEDATQESVDTLTHPEWSFLRQQYEVDEKAYSSEVRRDYCIARVSLASRRNPFFQVINLGVPLFVIILLFNLCLMIRRDLFDARLGGVVTCLLSMIAFALMASGATPKVPYLTLFGWFVVVAYCFIAMGAAVVVAEQIDVSQSSARERRLLKVTRIVTTAIHIGCALYLLAWIALWIWM